jgi:hypothetical protein
LRDELGGSGFLYRGIRQPDAQISGLIDPARATTDLAERQPIIVWTAATPD